MNLQLIKSKVEEIKYPGGLTGLADDVNMTVQNLHRCVRENKIQAQDLERIAKLLNVRVGYFFDEHISVVHTEGDVSPASGNGDVSVVIGDAVLAEKVKALEALVAEKERTIQILMNK